MRQTRGAVNAPLSGDALPVYLSIMLRLGVLAFGLAAASACVRDFSLPGPDAQPVIQSVTPNHFYSGDQIAITATNLSADPTTNHVQFPNVGAVPGEGFDPSGALLVTVPDNIFEGSLIVVTPHGTSTPFESSSDAGDTWYWLGDGRPYLGTQVGSISLLHRPAAIAAVGGKLFVPSSLFRLLMSPQSDSLGLSSRVLALAPSIDGTYLYLAFADDGIAQVSTADNALVAQPLDVGFAIHAVAAGGTATAPFVYAVATDISGIVRVQTFSGDPLVLSQRDPITLPLQTATGALLEPDGKHLVVVGQTVQDGANAGSVVVVDMTPLSPSPETLAAPADRRPVGAMTLLPVGPSTRVAVAFDDGSVGLLSVGAGPAWHGSLNTGTPSAPGALAVANPAGPSARLLATKPADGVVSAIDPVKNVVAWSTSVRGTPLTMAVDASTGILYAADDSANGVDELRAADGTWLGRISLNLDLGSDPRFAGGPVPNYPAVSYDSPGPFDMFVLARRQRQVVIIDDYTLEVQKPIALGGATPPLGLATAPDGTVWAIHEGELGLVSGKRKQKGEQIVATDLTAPPTRVAFTADGTLLVGSPQEVAVYKNQQRAGALLLPGKNLVDLERLNDGKILVLWTEDGATGRALNGGSWTADELAGNAMPDHAFTSAPGWHGFFGAASLVYGPVLFFNICDGFFPVGTPKSLSGSRCGILLDDNLGAPLLPSTASVKEDGVVAITPDKRYFVYYRKATDDGVLRILDEKSSSDMAANGLDFGYYETFAVERSPGTPGFDPSGAYMYVPLPVTDRVLVFQ